VPLKYVTRAARKPAIYGYARDRPDGLSLDAQVKQLRSREGLAGNERRVRRAPDQLAKGDLLMVTRLRLHRRGPRARQGARGVKIGRRPKLINHQKREAIRRRDHGDETLAEIGHSYARTDSSKKAPAGGDDNIRTVRPEVGGEDTSSDADDKPEPAGTSGFDSYEPP
jgi:hypothetical protein